MKARIAGLRDYVGGAGLGPRVVRATAGSAAVQAAGMALSFLVGVQLARGLGVAGYGIYGIAMAVIALVSVPGELGIPKLVMREAAAASAREDPASLRGVLRWADRTGLLIGLGAALAIALVLAIGGTGSPAATAILWGTPIIPLVALARNRGTALQGLQHIVRGQVPSELLRPLAFAILLFLMFTLLPAAGAPQAMALNGLTAACALLLGHLWLKRRLPAGPVTGAQASRPGLLKSAMSMALADGFRIGQLHLATLLLGLLATASVVGLFRIATSIIVIIGLPVALVGVVVSPMLARLFAQGDARRLQQLCTHSARSMTLAVAALALPFLFWGGPLIAFVFGPDFAPAQAALLVLAAGQVLTAAFGLNTNLLTMTGHERRVTRAMFWGLVTGIALTLALVPVWAEVGAAAATVGALLVWNVLAWIDAWRLLAIDTSVVSLSRHPQNSVERG